MAQSSRVQEVVKRVGHYEFGGTPTILEAGPSANLTNVHEQTHRDNINNTFYGYILWRCVDLADGDDKTAAAAGVALETLADAAWHTLEGAALAAEFSTRLQTEQTLTIEKYVEQLPSSYRAAFEHFRPLLQPMVRAGRDLRVCFLTQAYVHAVAECSLDVLFLTGSREPANFEAWANAAIKVRPDEVLDTFVHTATKLTSAKVPPNYPGAGGKIEVLFRAYVAGLKASLLASALPSRKANVDVSDTARLALVKEVDQALRKGRPSLPKVVFFDCVDGLALATPISPQPGTTNASRHPLRVLADVTGLSRIFPTPTKPVENISLDDLRRYMIGWNEDRRIWHVIYAFVRDIRGQYSGTVVPIRCDDGKLRTSAYYNLHRLARSDIIALDRENVRGKLIWYTTYVAEPRDPISFYDAETLSGHCSPTYVYNRAYHGEWLRQVLSRQHDSGMLRAGRLPGVDEWVVLHATLSSYRFDVFWLLRGLDLPDSGLLDLGGGLRFRVEDLSQDSALLAIALTTLQDFGAASDEESETP